MKSERYVYTMSAVRSALRRGRRSVLLCMPYTCQLVRVTSRNVRQVARRFSEAWR